MDDNKFIEVLAGSNNQVRNWVRRNVIPVTDTHELDRIRGIKEAQVIRIGTWTDLNPRVVDTVEAIFGKN